MGGYKEHAPATYLVGWRDHDVIKAGFTCNQRWRKFVIRGAELLHVQFFEVARDAFAFESDLDQALLTMGGRAFNEKTAEARSLLGADGGGYLECRRVDQRRWDAFVAEQCSPVMLASNARQQWHGRTYGTDALRTASPTRDNSPSVTRTRTYGICEVER